jgi:hypothetical protein
MPLLLQVLPYVLEHCPLKVHANGFLVLANCALAHHATLLAKASPHPSKSETKLWRKVLLEALQCLDRALECALRVQAASLIEELSYLKSRVCHELGPSHYAARDQAAAQFEHTRRSFGHEELPVVVLSPKEILSSSYIQSVRASAAVLPAVTTAA